MKENKFKIKFYELKEFLKIFLKIFSKLKFYILLW